MTKWFALRRPLQQRYILTAMAFMAVMLMYHTLTVLSATLPQMIVDHRNSSELVTNCEYNSTDVNSQFNWSEESQGLMLSALFMGGFVTSLIGGIIADRYGGKPVVAASIFFCSVCSLLYPLAAEGGEAWMIGLRFTNGLAHGTCFPSVLNLMSKWIPPEERTLHGSIIVGGIQLGTVTANLLAGGIYFLFPGRWALTFYITGGIGIAWVVLFFFVCSSSPATHRYITDEEMNYLKERISTAEIIKDIPWRSILTSVPVNAYFFGIFGFYWCCLLMVSDLPKYMEQTMNLSPVEAGIMSSLPFLAMWLVSTISGIFCDKIMARFKIKLTAMRKVFTAFSLICPIIGMTGAAYLEDYPTLVIVLLSFGIGAMGSSNAGMELLAADMSPNFTGTIVAISCYWCYAPGIIAPYVVGIVAPNQTADEWRPILLASSGICLVTLIIVIFFASAEVQPWNDVETNSELTTKHTTPNDGSINKSV